LAILLAHNFFHLFYWTTFRISKPPCLKNWVFSLRGLIYLTPKLFASNLTKFAPRCFNQDPVEIFFSCIRSYGFRNTNPTCSSFITSCKSLIINNFVSPHSAGANWESDESIGSLDIKQPNLERVTPDVASLNFSNFEVVPNVVANYTSAYVAGFVARKVLAKNSSCNLCKEKMCSKVNLEENVLIVERQYEACNLIHPSSHFTAIFKQITKWKYFKIYTLLRYKNQVDVYRAKRISARYCRHVLYSA
jgi:hypothetical protein